MFYRIGSILNINGLQGKIVGYIEYINPNDGNKNWYEYRLSTSQGEFWLSCDEHYNEYSISWPNNNVRGQIDPEWHKVDEGTQIVKSYGGDVDVDPGERANFIEFEDCTEERTLSVEIWSDGTEYSTGSYIEPQNIQIVGFEEPRKSRVSSSAEAFEKKLKWGVLAIFICIFTVNLLSGIGSPFGSGKKISKYLESSGYYEYQTSITGQEKQKAQVYVYCLSGTTDSVAIDIIDNIDGETESVTQKDDMTDEEIAIVTDKEYCLIYHPEDDDSQVLVQVSSRKYNYTSDNAPYRSSKATLKWYRNHYYSSSYSKDSSSYKKSPSAYSMYDGSTVHNIGNGYFDSYSKSVKQSSINNRNSSSGGISSGK